MKLVFATMFLLGAMGLSRLDAAPPAPSAGTTASMNEEAAPAAELDGSETSVICPQKWTCNNRNWYSTEATCNASCGGVCYLDYRCTGGCVCP